MPGNGEKIIVRAVERQKLSHPPRMGRRKIAVTHGPVEKEKRGGNVETFGDTAGVTIAVPRRTLHRRDRQVVSCVRGRLWPVAAAHNAKR